MCAMRFPKNFTFGIICHYDLILCHKKFIGNVSTGNLFDHDYFPFL